MEPLSDPCTPLNALFAVIGESVMIGLTKISAGRTNVGYANWGT